jgi:Flp pilus assembly protein TadG
MTVIVAVALTLVLKLPLELLLLLQQQHHLSNASKQAARVQQPKFQQHLR